LIVNADDFGQSPSINAGIIRAYEHGIVTSASMMVRWPAASEASAYALAHPELGVGLHVDLGEWARVNGDWVPRYRVVDEDDPEAVELEVLGQLERFRELMGRDPTHLDGHQHVQRSAHPGRVLTELANDLGVVLRDRSRKVRYEGGFYGRTPDGPFPEGITVHRLLQMLSSLPAGTTELGCHPGLGGDVESDYLQERSLEVETLSDPRVREAIDRLNIRLQSFAGVAV
jgi:predicted glycoside hydrolase/deacetylase ChbG (UPF0249 family)